MDQNLVSIDETDIEILRHVEHHGMEQIKEIAAKLDLSKSTIYYRIDRLEEKGVIEAIRAELNPLALGLNMLVFTNIYVAHDPGYAEDIGQHLADINGVLDVYYTMGDVDFIVTSRVPNRERMNELIDNIIQIEGVNKTSSTFVMDEVKSNGKLIDTLSPSMVEEIVNEETSTGI